MLPPKRLITRNAFTSSMAPRGVATDARSINGAKAGVLGIRPSPIAGKLTDGGTEAKEQAILKREAAQQAAAPQGVADYGLDQLMTSDMYMEDPTILGPSARAGVQADPAAIAAQQKAMNELFGLYEGGGATAQERARMAATRADQDQYLRSQREAHQQDLTERGMDGSGAEIAALLGDRQAAGQRMSMADLETEAMLQDRALQSLMEGNKIAGQIRGSSFDEGQARGKAQDEFSLMNTSLINGAVQSNKDWLRQGKAEIESKKFDSWQRGLDRGVGVAEGIMDFDANENKTGWDSGQDTARRDTDRFNGANDAVRDTVGDTAGDAAAAYGVSSGRDAAFGAAREEGYKSTSELGAGVGGIGDGVASAAAAGASGGATAGFPTGSKDDDEEDK